MYDLVLIEYHRPGFEILIFRGLQTQVLDFAENFMKEHTESFVKVPPMDITDDLPAWDGDTVSLLVKRTV